MDEKVFDTNERFDRIELITKDFSISKYNLLKISFLKRLIEDSQKFSDSCNQCQSNLQILDVLINEIPKLDQIDHRGPYEQKFNSIRTHFHKEHNYIPLYYFSSRWTIVGALAGTLITMLVLYVLKKEFSIDPFLAGAVFGLIVGYLIGTLKEVKYRKSNRII